MTALYLLAGAGVALYIVCTYFDLRRVGRDAPPVRDEDFNFKEDQ